MDMMTKIANLIAETMTAVWPEAEGLPDAEELRGLLASLGSEFSTDDPDHVMTRGELANLLEGD